LASTAALLRDEFDLVHVATGDLLRDHRARDTDLGLLHRIDASRPIAGVYDDARGLLAHLSRAPTFR
jgi:hypothetical protein